MKITLFPMKKLMKVSKYQTFSIFLFIVVLMAAVFYFNPGSARTNIQILKQQRVPLIIETSAYRYLYNDLSSDICISQSDESFSDDSENDEEDDDWEA